MFVLLSTSFLVCYFSYFYFIEKMSFLNILNEKFFLTKIFFNIINKYTIVEMKLKEFYNKNESFKEFVDMCILLVKGMQLFFLNHNIEPDKDIWCSKNILYYYKTECDDKVTYENITHGQDGLYIHDICYDKTVFELEESYVDDCDFLNEQNIESELLKSYDESKEYLINDHIEEILYTIKYKDSYIVRRVNSETPMKPIVFEDSEADFMSIEYKHPLQRNPITIVIPTGMHKIGNEILSPSFVLRFLKYQPSSFHFDMEYTIHIIDNDVNMFTLKSDQYLLLTPEGYEIQKI